MLNKYSSTPLYAQLKEQLLKDFENGKYKAGEVIPSENELAANYSLSRPTVRQALAELTNAGYLYKIKGKGTFLTNYFDKKHYDHTKGFLYCLLDTNDASTRTIMQCRVLNANRELNTKFSSDDKTVFHDDYTQIKYTIKEEENDIYCISYLPFNYFPKASEQLKNNALTMDLLIGKYPLEPTSSKSSLTIESADDELSEILNVPINAPLIKIETYLYSRSANTVEYNISYLNAHTSVIDFNKSRRV